MTPLEGGGFQRKCLIKSLMFFSSATQHQITTFPLAELRLSIILEGLGPAINIITSSSLLSHSKIDLVQKKKVPSSPDSISLVMSEGVTSNMSRIPSEEVVSELERWKSQEEDNFLVCNICNMMSYRFSYRDIIFSVFFVVAVLLPFCWEKIAWQPYSLLQVILKVRCGYLRVFNLHQLIMDIPKLYKLV